MRVLSICVLALAYAAALPSEEFASLLQETQSQVADLKAKGATEADCADLARTMCTDVEIEQKTSQEAINAISSGAHCKDEGQVAVTEAQAQLDAKTKELEDAVTAVSTAESQQVVFSNQVYSSLTPTQCGTFYTSGSNYQALLTTVNNAISHKAIKSGEKTQAHTALESATAAALQAKNTCYCHTKQAKKAQWDLFTATSVKTRHQQSWDKCKMMQCVLKGTPSSNPECKGDDLPSLTEKTLAHDVIAHSCH